MSNPIYLSWKQQYINKRLTELRYRGVALTEVTDNLQPAQRYRSVQKNVQIETFRHLRTNTLIIN